MRRLRYNAATSLDGFIAPLDGSSDWIVEDDSIDFAALYAEFDVFLMGRKTYEVMTSFEQNPLAHRTKESVVVVSRQMKPEHQPGITTLSAKNFIDAIRQMKAEPGKDIWLMGGGQLAGPCLEAGLIDSVEAAIMPVVLGKGIKMVAEPGSGDGGKSYRLELEGVKKLDKSGILMTRYRVVYAANDDPRSS